MNTQARKHEIPNLSVFAFPAPSPSSSSRQMVLFKRHVTRHTRRARSVEARHGILVIFPGMYAAQYVDVTWKGYKNALVVINLRRPSQSHYIRTAAVPITAGRDENGSPNAEKRSTNQTLQIRMSMLVSACCWHRQHREVAADDGAKTMRFCKLTLYLGKCYCFPWRCMVSFETQSSAL